MLCHGPCPGVSQGVGGGPTSQCRAGAGVAAPRGGVGRGFGARARCARVRAARGVVRRHGSAGLSNARVRVALQPEPGGRAPPPRRAVPTRTMGLGTHRRRQTGSPFRAGSLCAAARADPPSGDAGVRACARARRGAASLRAARAPPAGGGGTAGRRACPRARGGVRSPLHPRPPPPTRLLSPAAAAARGQMVGAGGRQGRRGGRRWEDALATAARAAPPLQRAEPGGGVLARAGPQRAPPAPPRGPRSPQDPVSAVRLPPGLRPFVPHPPARAGAPPPGWTPRWGRRPLPWPAGLRWLEGPRGVGGWGGGRVRAHAQAGGSSPRTSHQK